MVAVDAGWIGPDGLGGAYKNKAEVLQAQSWYALGGVQGVIKGMALSGVAGSMAVTVAAGAALVSRRDGSNNVQDMGYLVPVTTATTVTFGAASPSTRNDALVVAVVDTTDGAVGTGGLSVGGQLVAVPGVSGTSTPRTDAQIAAYLGRGGFVRLADVPIATTDTQINMANVAAAAPYNVVDTGWVNMTPASGTGTCRYRHRAGVVSVQVSLSGVTSLTTGSNGSIVSAANGLPAAYRPTATVYQAGSAGGASSTLGLISPDGSISQWNNAGFSVNVARLYFTYML